MRQHLLHSRSWLSLSVWPFASDKRTKVTFYKYRGSNPAKLRSRLTPQPTATTFPTSVVAKSLSCGPSIAVFCNTARGERYSFPSDSPWTPHRNMYDPGQATKFVLQFLLLLPHSIFITLVLNNFPSSNSEYLMIQEEQVYSQIANAVVLTKNYRIQIQPMSKYFLKLFLTYILKFYCPS